MDEAETEAASHDQLFKELLRAFFREFIELFFPDMAARLDFGRVTFLDKELFTDLSEGDVREPDLVAQTYTQDGTPELALIHVEVQAQRRTVFRYCVFEYYALLRLRYKLPVFPIALYLVPGTGGITRETYTESLFGQAILTFSYAALGVPDLNADDYLEREGPLAPALAALMQASALGLARQKQVSLQRVAVSGLNDARKFLLANIIETYLKLTPEEQERYEQMLQQPEAREVRQMISVYELRGREAGREEGREEGLEAGREEGVLIGKRDILLRLLRLRFGAVPEAVEARIQSITSEEILDALADQVLTATALQDIQFPAK